jgi:transcriptional/translational regulatory protein YebC/TACO1
MVIIDCLTDNANRTFGDVRLCFTKTKSKIGTQGSVSHMFDHSAIFVFAGEDEEGVLEALMEADVDVSDIENEDGKISVFAPNTDYFKAKQALIEFGVSDFEVDEIQFLPQNTTTIEGDDVAMFDKFMDMLNDLDDVQNVYHNVEL